MSDQKPEGKEPKAKKPKAEAAPVADAPKKRMKASVAGYEPRLKTRYKAEIRKRMKEQFGYTNEMQIPKLDKIVINMGIGEAVADSKKANSAMKDLEIGRAHV